jgi:hypothetical protein
VPCSSFALYRRLLVDVNKGFKLMLIFKDRVNLLVLNFAREIEVILKLALGVGVNEVFQGLQRDSILFLLLTLTLSLSLSNTAS